MNKLVIGMILLGIILVGVCLYNSNRDVNQDANPPNPNGIFSYNSYHKYNSNQFRPADACYDKFYEYAEKNNIQDETIRNTLCTGSSNDDLNVGGILKCTCEVSKEH